MRSLYSWSVAELPPKERSLPYQSDYSWSPDHPDDRSPALREREKYRVTPRAIERDPK